MWRKVGVIGLMLLFGGLPATALAASTAPGGVVIREVLLGTSASANEEYIVVTNNTGQSLAVQGLEIDYKSATGASWARRAIIAEARSLAPQASLKFAAQGGDVGLTTGLAAAGGNLRILWNGQVIDQLAWGTGNSPEGSAVAAPAVGQTLQRICTKSCQDTGNNATDFGSTSAPVARGATKVVGSVASAVAAAGSSDYAIEITELLPDPVSPQADAKDEFVELHNAGSTTAELTGWALSDGKAKTKLDGIQIAAGGYAVLTSGATTVSLNNSGEELSLIAPDGQVVMATPNYGKALAGQSFGATPEGWGWLDKPTPGGANTGLSAKQSAEKSTASKSNKKSSPSTTKKTSKTASAAKLAQAKGETTGDGDQSEASAHGFAWGWVLAGLGVLAVGYGAYEYRSDISALYRKYRAKLTAGE